MGKRCFHGGPCVSLRPDPKSASPLPYRRRSATPSSCWRSWRPRLLPAVPLPPAGPGAAAERCRHPAGCQRGRGLRPVWCGVITRGKNRNKRPRRNPVGLETAGCCAFRARYEHGGDGEHPGGPLAPCGTHGQGWELWGPSYGISQHPAACTPCTSPALLRAPRNPLHAHPIP